ncbi:hypothetical protein ANCDUO_13789 [Ancylostoma duodenale]|uniref:Uncharacterized protein n=1 Tax=Ancylostoma duodenale TaxID=51022 RepID=A0A0C2CI20_9BILA|nr:hypothetical protein ANCDUO_13789 [Ancylostoma duodenale]
MTIDVLIDRFHLLLGEEAKRVGGARPECDACDPPGQPAGRPSIAQSRNCREYRLSPADNIEFGPAMEPAHSVPEQLASDFLPTSGGGVLHLPVLLKGEQYPRISIFEVDRDSGESAEYRLAVESGPAFDEVPLENAILGCGLNNLHIYDRSIVMGPIPYWNITLREDTFTLDRDDIKDESGEKCNRFPIAIDSAKRVFARLRDDHSLVVYNPDTKTWRPYFLAPGSHLSLDSLNVRGLHESFGRAGRRVGAVESPLTVYSDGPVVVARIKNGHKQYFYRVTFDHEKCEFLCERRGWAMFSGGVDRMFYTIVGENSLPPTLVECALMSLQNQHCKKDATGARMGGLSPEDIKKMVGYRGSSLIPV